MAKEENNISFSSLTTSQIEDILDSTTNGFLLTDSSHRVTCLNSRAEELLGVSSEHVIGENIWDAMPEMVSILYKSFVSACQKNTNVLVTEHYTVTERWLEINIHPGQTGIALSLKDITEKQLLKASNHKLQNIIGFANDGIVVANDKGTIESLNTAAEKIFGYQPDELIGKNVSLLMQKEHAQSHDTYVSNYLKTGLSRIIDVGPREVMACRKDGSSFPLDISLSDMQYGDKHYFIAILRDITERWQAKEQLQYLSNYDQLTGLPNRLLFSDRLNHAIQNARRQKTKLALLFIDLDAFKSVNDSLGHAAGDQLLKTIATRLESSLRESDTAARLSGDEFIVILENVVSLSELETVATKILAAISEPVVLGVQTVAVTSSIGISLYPDHSKMADTLLNLADSAMYQAKSQGKNKYCIYDGDNTTQR